MNQILLLRQGEEQAVLSNNNRPRKIMYVNKFRNLSKEFINYVNTYDLLIFNDTNSMKKKHNCGNTWVAWLVSDEEKRLFT